MTKSYVVVYDQRHRIFWIQGEYWYLYAKGIMDKISPPFVYTDIYTGTEEQCIKFCKIHQLKFQ